MGQSFGFRGSLMSSSKQSKGFSGQELKSLAKSVQPTLDLVIVMDVTGSMEGHLQEAKTQATVIYGKVAKLAQTQRMKARMAFVGYRDFGDEEQHIVHDFVGSGEGAAILESALGPIVATGGGDFPEDVLGALNQASQLNWQEGINVLVLMGDAPGHGRELCDVVRCVDAYPDGNPDGLTADSVLSALKDKKVDLYFAKVPHRGTTDALKKMDGVFDKKYRNMGGNYTSVRLSDDPAAFMPTVLSSVGDSVSKSKPAPPPRSGSTEPGGSTMVDFGPSACRAAISGDLKKVESEHPLSAFKKPLVDAETSVGKTPTVAAPTASRFGMKELISEWQLLVDDGLMSEEEFKERKEKLFAEATKSATRR